MKKTHDLQLSSRLRPFYVGLCAIAVAASAVAQQSTQARAPAVVPANLPVVTVTATLTEQDTRTAPASVTIITREDLQARNAGDLLEALRDAPGFTFSPRQVGGRKTIALRGLEGRHTLTLIDGRRISPSDDVVGHSDYQYGWLPVSAIERIEVIRGPMSALYGSEALGGVINVITRKSLDRWISTVQTSGTMPEGNDGYGTSASAFLSGRLSESLLLRANLEILRSDPVAEKEDTRVSEIEGRESRGGGLEAVLKLSSQQTLEAGITGGKEERTYDALSGGQVYTNIYDIDRTQAHLRWNGDFGAFKGQVRTYRSEIDIQNARTNGVSATRPQNLADHVLDGHFSLRLGDQMLTAGGEWREERLRNSGLVGGEDAAGHKAVFVQDELALSKDLLLTAGLRYDHHELFGGETSPRVYVVWEASPTLVIKGGAGHAFKAPTLKQISPNYVGAEGPHTFLGNAAVRPESADSAEIAADWTVGALSLRGSVFRTHVDDLITYKLLKVSGSRRTYQYDNVDSARITGIESGLTWALTRSWNWAVDLTFLRAKDGTTGKKLADRPDVSAATHLAWKGGAGWSARLGGAYTGSQSDSTDVRLPSYWLWNASVGKQVRRGLIVRAGLENLGDLRLAQKSANFGYAERGRRLFVNVAAEF